MFIHMVVKGVEVRGERVLSNPNPRLGLRLELLDFELNVLLLLGLNFEADM